MRTPRRRSRRRGAPSSGPPTLRRGGRRGPPGPPGRGRGRIAIGSLVVVPVCVVVLVPFGRPGAVVVRPVVGGPPVTVVTVVRAGSAVATRGHVGLAPAKLLHEVVEQVLHVARSLRCAARQGSRRAPRARLARPAGDGHQGRARPSTERRKAARAVSASSFGRIVAARAGSQRRASRIATGERHG